MQTEAAQPDQDTQHLDHRVIRGLYAVTPDSGDTAELCRLVEKALVGGASAVQYRSKNASAGLRLEQAGQLAQLCRRHGALFIVNDDPELAARVDADGVHLGAEDASIESARVRLGRNKMVGISCYNDLQLAIRAQEAGADYVAFGSFFASAVKPGAVRAPIELLARAKSVLAVPVVAIGGINEENAPWLVQAGADGIAVISALFAARDVQAAAKRLSGIFTTTHENQPKAF